MRQRITYIQEPQDSVDPKTLKVTKDSISGTTVKAAREEKLTLGFDELPPEIYAVLKASHELHVRWVSETPYEAIAPLVSRLSPGLHVFYTPQRNSKTSSLLCPILKKAFGELDCVSPECSFTTLPVERFSHSAALQYYSPVPTITRLREFLIHRFCEEAPLSRKAECQSRVEGLEEASYIDFNFDTISHALTLTAYYPPSTQSISLTNSYPGSSRLEVGILSVEKPIEPEELSLGGFLTVVGEDSKPSPTLFSFPARHHPLAQTFTSDFRFPTGLHPRLELNITHSKPPLGDQSCSLHAHLTLPRQIFADKYQLFDPVFMVSKGLSTVRYITIPVDLEAPTYAIDLWGSSVLIELSPLSTQSKSISRAEIPLHLRYLYPNSGRNGQEPLSVPYPAVFWACTADEGTKFPINPFDRVNLGYDGLFGPRTIFYHLAPEPVRDDGRLVSTLNVPVLDLDQSTWVESGTAAAVGVGFLWVLWCLIGVWRSVGYGSRGLKAVQKENKIQ